MEIGIRPTVDTYRSNHYLYTRQSYNSISHADSYLKISTSDRGQLTPTPRRDLSFEFSRVSENGRAIGGRVTFHSGEEVKLLLDYLKAKFNDDGSLKGEVQK